MYPHKGVDFGQQLTQLTQENQNQQPPPIGSRSKRAKQGKHSQNQQLETSAIIPNQKKTQKVEINNPTTTMDSTVIESNVIKSSDNLEINQQKVKTSNTPQSIAAALWLEQHKERAQKVLIIESLWLLYFSFLLGYR